MEQYKYCIAAPVDPEQSQIIEMYRHHVHSHLRMPISAEPYQPHVTLHRPFTLENPYRIPTVVESIATLVPKARLRYVGLDRFGDRDVLLPMVATYHAAQLWVSLGDLLKALPGYRHQDHDGDNTLHVSLASKVDAECLKRAWSSIARMHVEPADLTLTTITVFRALNEPGAQWQPCKLVHLATTA